MNLTIRLNGHLTSLDTSLLDDREYYAIFPEIWEAVTRPLAERCGHTIYDLRQKNREKHGLE